jgi:pilus assembly protein CpaE
MSGALRVSICDPNERTRDTLKKFLVGTDKVWLEADCSRYEFFTEIVQQTTPEVVIVDIDSDEQKALALVESLSRTFPNCGIVVISKRTDGQMILRAMRAGAREFLNSPIQIEELVGALDRVGSSLDGVSRTGSHSIIAVAGSSGGVGTTSIAINLAVALAQSPDRSVALIDMDLALGDADVFLDMVPDYTLLDVAQNISRLDLTLLRKSLTKHDTGVYLLPRPIQIEDAVAISKEDLRKVLALLKASFSHLVIDISKTFSALDMVALEAANHIVLITQLDLPCLRNVVRLLTSFESHEGMSQKVKVVVNRTGLDKAHISTSKAEETIDREIFWRIPNNYAVISECRNNGIPLIQHAPKAAITHSIQELAEKMVGESGGADPAQEPKKDKRGWLKFLGK